MRSSYLWTRSSNPPNGLARPYMDVWAAAEQDARGGHLTGRRVRIVAMKARADLIGKCGRPTPAPFSPIHPAGLDKPVTREGNQDLADSGDGELRQLSFAH